MTDKKEDIFSQCADLIIEKLDGVGKVMEATLEEELLNLSKMVSPVCYSSDRGLISSGCYR